MIKHLFKALFFCCIFFNTNIYSQEQFIGEIQIISSSFAPKGWALCNGQLLPINQYQALFSLLGTTYGGNGVTNFALPDLRGRVAVGMGNTIVQGEKGGTENNVLTSSNLPSHSHTISASTTAGNQNLPTGNIPAESSELDPEYSNANATSTMANTMVSPAGNNQPINNIQPSIGCMYIIALQGIYPSRN